MMYQGRLAKWVKRTCPMCGYRSFMRGNLFGIKEVCGCTLCGYVWKSEKCTRAFIDEAYSKTDRV